MKINKLKMAKIRVKVNQETRYKFIIRPVVIYVAQSLKGIKLPHSIELPIEEGRNKINAFNDYMQAIYGKYLFADETWDYAISQIIEI